MSIHTDYIHLGPFPQNDDTHQELRIKLLARYVDHANLKLDKMQKNLDSSHETNTTLKARVEDLTTLSKNLTKKVVSNKKAYLALKAQINIQKHQFHITTLKILSISTMILSGIGILANAAAMIACPLSLPITLPFFALSIAGLLCSTLIADLPIRKNIGKQECAIWILQNFPESLESEEIKTTAKALIMAHMQRVKEAQHAAFTHINDETSTSDEIEAANTYYKYLLIGLETRLQDEKKAFRKKIT